MVRGRAAKSTVPLLLLGLILLVGGTLRVRHITSSPGWFRDEGTYMEAAWNAVRGEARIGPLNHTWLSPWQTHPPLHAVSSGLWMHVVGAVRGDHRPNIQPFRWFSAVCGLAVILGVYAAGVSLGSTLLALLAAAILAVDPWAVMFHRMGLPYNLLAVEIVGVLLLVHWHLREPSAGRAFLVMATAATAPLTVYYGIALPIAVAVTLAIHGRMRDVWSVAVGLAPLALFLGALWLIRPVGLEADWLHMRAVSGGTWNPADWVRDFIGLLSISPLVVLGLFGLLLLPRGGLATCAQITTVLYLFTWLRRADNLLWSHDAARHIHLPAINYQIIPLLPLLALGAAQVALTAWRHLRGDAVGGHAPSGAARQHAAGIMTGALLAVTLGSMAWISLRAIQSGPAIGVSASSAQWGFQSPLSHTLGFAKSEVTGDPPEILGVGPFVWSQRVEPNDLIIAEYPLWWTLPGRHATLTQAIAFNGGRADFFHAPVPRERFAYDCDWREARFVILGPLTARWRAEGEADVRLAVREIETGWSEVHRAGSLRVYAPPRTAREPDAFIDEFWEQTDLEPAVTPDAASP